MIHRQWLLPGICAAFFTLLLALTFYQSDYRIVVQRPGGIVSSVSCVPAPANNTIDEQSITKSSNTTQNLYEPSKDLPAHELAEVIPAVEDDGITSFPPGTILSADLREVKMRDGSHSLRLEDNGNVILYRDISHSTEQNKTLQLWSLGTGAVEKEFEYTVRLTEEGVLHALALLRHEDGSFNEQLLWHSDMLPGCRLPDATGPPPAQSASLTITSNGEVAIPGRCVLFTPAPDSVGKLAVLVSGLYRSNRQVCSSQVEYLANYPGATSVEFFVYALYEKNDIHDDVTVEFIEQGIRACYGPYLRTLTLKPVEEVSENWPGEGPPRCGTKIHRLLSQLKTLYNGGQEWLEYSAAQAIKHNTVLRIRTDHEFYGDALPTLKPASQLQANELVMQPIAGGWPVPLMSHWYCSNPFGSIDIGISDQLAYGRPTAMHFYLNLYKNFQRIVDMSVKENNNASRESWLCLTMPSGTEQQHCGAVEYCTIECAISWYLQVWDLDVVVNWDWPLRIIRA